MSPEVLLGRLGKYELLKELGRGAFGVVYLARDRVLGVERAVKVLHPVLMTDPELVERFRREAQTVARLGEHPHIVTVYELGEDEGHFYIVMKYMGGGSLRVRLEQEGPLSWEEVVRIVREVADGLHYAHQQGVIHRDLKPSNILFDVEGRAAVVDFGFAKVIEEASESLGLTDTESIVGTPLYIAPEVWKGDKVTPAIDQYALACITYEMLTGKPLFTGETPEEIMRKHLEEPISLSDIREVPQDATLILRKALAKQPADRFDNVLAFAEALEIHGRVIFGGKNKIQKLLYHLSVFWAHAVLLGRTLFQGLQKILLNEERRLSPWNLFDYWRFLWWILVAPNRWDRYHELHGDKADHPLRSRLAYSFTLWSLLLPLLGLALGFAPYSSEALDQSTYGWLAVGVGAFWGALFLAADGLEILLEDVEFSLKSIALFIILISGIFFAMAFVTARGIAYGAATGVGFVIATVVINVISAIVAGLGGTEVSLATTFFLALGVGMGVVSGVIVRMEGIIARIITGTVAACTLFGAGIGIEINVVKRKTSRWALSLLILSWIFLVLFCLGVLI